MNIYDRNNFPKQTTWEKIRWALFGEMRIFIWFWVISCALSLVWAATVYTVVLHFLIKYW